MRRERLVRPSKHRQHPTVSRALDRDALARQSFYSPGVSAVTLLEVTDDNREAILALRVAPAQERFVGTVAAALTVAQEIPEGKPWYRAVYAGDQPVGFVMLSWNVEPEPPRIIGPWFLWKLLIDERHQRRGYGRKAVGLVADIVRAEGAAELLTSFAVGDGGPGPFYRSLGFSPTGERDENGEIILALSLAPIGSAQSSSR
jgi:GNAT superfamily N-acetyltransferase